jgi:hypothetical protein
MLNDRFQRPFVDFQLDSQAVVNMSDTGGQTMSNAANLKKRRRFSTIVHEVFNQIVASYEAIRGLQRIRHMRKSADVPLQARQAVSEMVEGQAVVRTLRRIESYTPQEVATLAEEGAALRMRTFELSGLAWQKMRRAP